MQSDQDGDNSKDQDSDKSDEDSDNSKDRTVINLMKIVTLLRIKVLIVNY